MNMIKAAMTLVLAFSWIMPTSALACMECFDSAEPPLVEEAYLIDTYPARGEQKVPTNATMVFVVVVEGHLYVNPESLTVSLTDENANEVEGELTIEVDDPASYMQNWIIYWKSSADLEFDNEYELRLNSHISISGLQPIVFRTDVTDVQPAPRVVDFTEHRGELITRDGYRCNGADMVTVPTCAEVTMDELIVRYRVDGIIDEDVTGGSHFVRLSQADSEESAWTADGIEAIDFASLRPRAWIDVSPGEWATDQVCTALEVTRIGDEVVIIEEVRCEQLDFEAILVEANQQRQSAINAWYEENRLEVPNSEDDNEVELQTSGCEVVNGNPLSPLGWLLFAGLFLNRRQSRLAD